jgi:hypothetical protein
MTTKPAPYYATETGTELAALPANMRINYRGRSRPIDPDNLAAVGILRLIPATPPEGFVVTASHGETRTDAAGKVIAWVEVIDATRSLAEVEAEERAAAMPPESVIRAALALRQSVVDVATEFGVVLDLNSGYSETYAAIFRGIIPAEHQARVWALVDTAYRNLDYHIQKWQTGAVTWDMLPQIAAALETLQQPGE